MSIYYFQERQSNIDWFDMGTGLGPNDNERKKSVFKNDWNFN